MILGAHVIISAYAFWLPNEPRGSWSDFVRSWELFRFGPATKVDTHRSVAKRPYDRAKRRQMIDALDHEPVLFSGKQALAIAHGFAAEVKHSGCIIHACAVLPDHSHLVLPRHTYDFDKLINRLKGSATRKLKEYGLHPFASEPYRNGKLPSPWGRKWWTVYLDSDADMTRASTYVENNPLKEGKKKQNWKFVVPYYPTF
jgi:REP element-mobilizing transposase RayT